MGQIVIIEPNQNLQELISLNLRTYIGAEVIPRDGATDCMALLALLPTIDLIICRNEIGEEKTALEISEYIEKEQLPTQLIILGQTIEPELTSKHTIQTNPKNWEAVISSTAKLLGFKSDILKKKFTPDFIPVPLSYFYHLENSCCDVFIRIKKGPDDFQFVKRIHNGDSFSKQMIQKYEDQGLKSFYIPKQDQKNFTNSVSDQLVQKLNKFKEEPPQSEDEPISDEFIIKLDASLNIAINEIKQLGFTSATIQLTDSIIDGMVKSVDKSDKMSSLLRKVLNAKAQYLYQHCHLTTIVTTQMLRAFKKDSEENLELLAYTSFFKDIALGDKPELARISTQKELDEQDLDPEDWGLVMNHAAEGAQIVRGHPEAPISLDTMILTHHGSPDGRGFFTDKQDELANFNLLQQIFVLSSDFVKELLVYKDRGGPPKPIILTLKERYPQNAVQEIIKIMEATLSSKK